MAEDVDVQPTPSRLARVALDNLDRAFPYHLVHLVTGADDVAPPAALTPLFATSFDWHSSVHQHWLAVRLVRRDPGLPESAALRAALARRITDAGVAREVAYLRHPDRRAFERPYGWAWLLALDAELAACGERWATDLRGRLRPLARLLRDRLVEHLAASPYPVRTGLHTNTAFAGTLALDAARATGDTGLADAVEEAAGRWYLDDRGWNAAFEPSATDFLSPALTEADLLTRVLDRGAFAAWFDGFLPDPAPLTRPAVVSDREDPQMVHLDGLNLSRAWAWRRIAAHLPTGHRVADVAHAAAERHAEAALPHVPSGHYVGDHWLPTFAAYLLTGPVGV